MALVQPDLVGSMVAHQGGWDEVLLIAGPIVAIVGLLMLAKRRVDRLGTTGDDDGDDGRAAERHTDAPT